MYKRQEIQRILRLGRNRIGRELIFILTVKRKGNRSDVYKRQDVFSEFMGMAATLIDIKCRMLLPKEVNEEGEEEDPRDELVRQLLEYKMRCV